MRGHAVPASIFARLRDHLAKFPGDIIPLQIGDTYLAPPVSLAGDDGQLCGYGSPEGYRPLIDAIVTRHRAGGLEIGPANIQITCGATHALSCAVQALCDPGDELILVTPHWPLIRGIALALGVVPIEVPFAGDPVANIARAITPRTTAIYFATPNNPDGEVWRADQLAALATLAIDRGLWLLADEVYQYYVYDAPHLSIAQLAGAAARSVTVYSFAKSYAQAGLRVGYAIAPEPVAATLKKLVNHTVYNVPVATQRAALAAMEQGMTFLDDARARYREHRDRALARLRAPAGCPPGGAYLWVDFSPWSGSDCMPVLEQCAAAGVLLAPGSAFGSDCCQFARLCFTGVPPERLDVGIDRINAVLR